jgi:hypothetical protein
VTVGDVVRFWYSRQDGLAICGVVRYVDGDMLTVFDLAFQRDMQIRADQCWEPGDRIDERTGILGGRVASWRELAIEAGANLPASSATAAPVDSL